jgi:hypothetical protein
MLYQMKTGLEADDLDKLREVKPGDTVKTVLGNRGGDPTTYAQRNQGCVAKVEGHDVSTNAYVTDEIGRDEAGNTIDLLFGALVMQPNLAPA